MEMIDSGYLFVYFLKRDGEAWLVQMANTPSTLSIACLVYSLLLSSEKITAIEYLDVEEKTELFVEAKRLSNDHSKAHIIKICKALHCLGSLIKLDDKEAQKRVEEFLSCHELKS